MIAIATGVAHLKSRTPLSRNLGGVRFAATHVDSTSTFCFRSQYITPLWTKSQPCSEVKYEIINVQSIKMALGLDIRPARKAYKPL